VHTFFASQRLNNRKFPKKKSRRSSPFFILYLFYVGYIYIYIYNILEYLGRSLRAGGQCVVLESASVKHALQKRYFDPWKKAEEEAAKPAVPGTKPKAAGEHNHSNPKL
jgi:hypothetical protein